MFRNLALTPIKINWYDWLLGRSNLVHINDYSELRNRYWEDTHHLKIEIQDLKQENQKLQELNSLKD